MNNLKTYTQFITEALGVPSGLLQQAEKSTTTLLEKINSSFAQEKDLPLVVLYSTTGQIKSGYMDGYQTYTTAFLLDGISFSDMTINELMIELVIRESSFANKIELDGLAYQLEFEQDTDLTKLVAKMEDRTTITIYINCPEETTWQQISEFVVLEQNQIYDSLTHELKHVYDYFKSNRMSFEEWADYKASLSMNTGIEAFSFFFTAIYYLSTIETLTRNTQFLSRLRRHGVFYEDFRAFVETDEIAGSLLLMKKKMNWANFKKSIANDPDLDVYLSLNFIQDLDGLTAEEKVEMALISVWQEYRQNKEMIVRRLLAAKMSSGFTQILVDKQMQSQIDKIVQKSLSTRNYEEFFKNWFALFNKQADAALRKLFKLIDTLPKRPRPKGEKMNLPGSIDQ
jgi:hypothetical protein